MSDTSVPRAMNTGPRGGTKGLTCARRGSVDDRDADYSSAVPVGDAEHRKDGGEDDGSRAEEDVERAQLVGEEVGKDAAWDRRRVEYGDLQVWSEVGRRG